jgi:transmembrane sensor
MTAESREQRRKQAEEQASMWLEKLERTLRDDESKMLREWLQVGMHREAIVTRCRLWHGPEILSVLSELIPVTLPLSRSDKLSRHFALAVFAAISALGLWTMSVALWSRINVLRDPLRAEETYRTPLGSPRKISLPDGSEMTLNTDSHALVSYGPTSRDVTLLRGEATFEVIEDRARIFRVHSIGRRFLVEEQGAKFNIRRHSNEALELTMIQGELDAVPARRAPPLTPAQLRAGYSFGERKFFALEGARLAPEGYLAWTQTLDHIGNQLAWHRGRILFFDETLDSALAEIERYTSTRFVFANDELRKKRVSAEIRVGDVDGVVQLLHDALQIESHRQPDDQVVLSSRGPQNAGSSETI